MNSIANNRPLITFQTGADKSYLIGTKEQLISFANSIIESVNSATETDFFGEQVSSSSIIYGCLDIKAEVMLDEVVITKSNEQKDEIFYKIHAL